jgi:hypothetical protein
VELSLAGQPVLATSTIAASSVSSPRCLPPCPWAHPVSSVAPSITGTSAGRAAAGAAATLDDLVRRLLEHPSPSMGR